MKKDSQHMNKKEVLSKIIPIIENVSAKNGLIPVEISFVKESNRWFLRIFIYSYDHPISHDDCKNVTRGLGDYLDELIPVNYYLEISSPGAERKFKSDKEFEIFKGKKIKLKLKKPLEENGEKIFFGYLIDFRSDTGLLMKLVDVEKMLNIKKENISSVNLCLEQE